MTRSRKQQNGRQGSATGWRPQPHSRAQVALHEWTHHAELDGNLSDTSCSDFYPRSTYGSDFYVSEVEYAKNLWRIRGFPEEMFGQYACNSSSDLEGPCIAAGTFSMPMVQYHQGQFQLGPNTGEALEIILPDGDSFFGALPAIEYSQLHPGDLRERFSLLSLPQQLEILRAKYSSPEFSQHPLLPPYSEIQVLAIEENWEIRFPPILRQYILNISRQHAMADSLQCIEDSLEEGFILHHTSWFTSDFLIPLLSGPFKGFIAKLQERNALEHSWMTIFEGLLEAKPQPLNAVSFRQRTGTEDPSFKSVLAGANKLGVPADLRDFKCRPVELSTYVKIFNESEDFVQSMIDDLLVPHVVRIQRQFRLWQWRLKVVFNPHTEIGHLNNLIHTRCAMRSID